jgi:uncharacterized protein
MAVKLNGSAEEGPDGPDGAPTGDATPSFPYSNWGPLAAIAALVVAVVLPALVAVPVVVIDHPPSAEELSTAANAVIQLAAELSFLLVPLALAMLRGSSDLREAARRLGVRRFKPSAVLLAFGVFVLYLAFLTAYAAIFGEPHQKDIAEELGPLSLQIVLIAIAAPICEEICFRGMLFAGLRERMPGLGAALVSGLIFGGLHATTGFSAVPPLMALGVVLALLYERTGSVVPGILLHMLNNSIVLLLAH